LAFWRYEEDEGSYVLCILPLEGGDPKELIREPHQASAPAWTADSREIVFSSARQASFDKPALWRISVSGGDPKRIDAAGEGTAFPAISPQGDRLSYSVWSWNLDIVKLEVEGVDKARTSATQLITSTRLDANPQISPDGKKIAFSSARTGQEQIWTCNSDGTDPVRLTHLNATDTSAPSWSPNGRFIVFNSNQEGHFDIYVVDSQGGPARRLITKSSSDVNPSWSQDSRWIYFASNRSGDYQIWKVPAEGGKPIQVTTNGGFKAEETRDGKWLYYVPQEGKSDLWRIPVSGGQETLVLEDVYRRGWALTDDGIYVLNPDKKPKPSLQFFDFAAGELRPADPRL
jgi:Tol biopolymer transport system component